MSGPDVRGRCAVVTGASRGLGAGLASAFAERGMRLALCSRGAPALPESKDVLAMRLDVGEEGALDSLAERAAERFGAIDLWVNNAGVLEPIDPVRDVASADFTEHVRVNLVGVFLGTRAYVRHRRQRGGGGVLVNVSSGAATKAYAGWGPYCAAKAAVEQLTAVVALEEAESGLRAHAVAPGVVDTDMQALIRACPPERFPEVERFRSRSDWNSPQWVARQLLEIAFDPARAHADTVVRLPVEGA